MGYAIETFGLTKVYRHHQGFSTLFRKQDAGTVAVNDVSLKIQEGEVFGLLGPNGSGKTTFLKMLSTVVTPSSGTASIFGTDIVQNDREVREMISLTTGEERSFYWRLTGRQNLRFFAKLYDLSTRELEHKVEELLELFDLTDMGDINVSEYSTGMKQRLAIARGLLNSPKLLFLDEPTRGLDPLAAHRLLDMLHERIVNYFDNTVILTTHIMREIERLSNRVAVLKKGNVVFSGTVEELSSSVDQYDRYTIRTSLLPQVSIDALVNEPSVMESSVDIDDGTVNLDVLLEKNSVALSKMLQRILGLGADVLHCTKHEPSLEETFRTLLHDEENEAIPPDSNG